MSGKVTPGWASAHLRPIRPGAVSIDAAEQLAVHQTLVRYAFALDQQDLAALEGVLTEDSRWSFLFANEVERRFDGRAAILDLVRTAADSATDQLRHTLSNIVLHSADATTAEAQAYLQLTSTSSTGVTLIGTGFYRFSLRQGTGGWRISELFLGTDTSW
jgi:3-phenylpropionate/cinnamic acid dioxygenase small subunit